MKAIVALVLFFAALHCGAKGNTNSTNSIQSAAWSGDFARVKNYLAASPQILHSKAGAGTLTAAAEGGQVEMAGFLISQGADVNERGFFDMTPLATIASAFNMNDDGRFQRYAMVAAVLLDHGAEVDAVDNYKKTPLLHAVECKQSELTQVLLEHGASQNETYYGVESVRMPTLLHMAIDNNDRETVKTLLKYHPPLDVKNSDDATPLVFAELLDRTEIAALIRPMTQDTNIIPSRAEMRALAKSAASGDKEALDELANIAQSLQRLILPDRNPYPHVPSPYILLRLDRMGVASRVLGEEVGRGDSEALQVLKNCLNATGQLRSWALGACGVAAAAGNKDALNILLAEDTQGGMNYQLREPAEANVEPAVNYFINWMNSDKPFQNGVGDVMTATNAVASAAAKGNHKAKDALEKFAARFPVGNN